MLRKRIKKAFTLVELVVVIAIIAILAGVSVAVYVGVTNKAKTAADGEIISQLNTQMRAKNILEGKNVTCYDAYLDAKEAGFDLELLKPQSGGKYVWDKSNDLFACVEVKNNDFGDVIAQDKTNSFSGNGWVFTNTINESANYNQYLNEAGNAETFNVVAGFDAGKNTKVKTINYVRPEGSAKEALIRTNTANTNLVVNAPNDDVIHYGRVGKETIQAVKGSSFHEYGEVAYMELQKGHVVVEKDASVDMLFANPSSTTAVLSVTNKGDIDHAHALTKEEAEKQNGTGTTTGLSSGIVFDYNNNVEQNTDITVYHHVAENEREGIAEGDTKVTNNDWETVEKIEIESQKIVEQQRKSEITSYGFHDSYRVDKGLETEHWVHEITNIVEFRNIVTNEGNNLAEFDGEKYPGYGDYNTVYLITKNINFGGAIWGPNDNELIDSFVFNGSLEGANEQITLSGYHLYEGLGTTKIMGIFEYAQHASFKNLILDDFEFNYPTGENCGFLAGKTLSDNYDADRILAFENILIKDTCSIEAYKSVGSLMGLARGCINLTAKNVVNNASVTATGNVNVGGLIAQASTGGSNVPNGSWVFDKCVNNGEVRLLNSGANLAGFVGQLVKYVTVTIKDCESNGDLYMAGTSVGYFVNTTTATVKAINFEGTNKITAVMHTLNGAGATTTNKAEPTAMEAQSSAFAEGSRNYSSPNETMAYTPVTVGFDEDDFLKITPSSVANFDHAVLSISIGDITVDVATNKSTGEGSMGIHLEERNTLDFSDIKKVTRIGYFAPNAETSVPTKHVTHFNLAKFFIDYTNRDAIGAGTRYDATGGFIVIDNTGAVNSYNAINARPDGTELVLYSISLFDGDGELIGGGKLSTYISGIFEF